MLGLASMQVSHMAMLVLVTVRELVLLLARALVTVLVSVLELLLA